MIAMTSERIDMFARMSASEVALYVGRFGRAAVPRYVPRRVIEQATRLSEWEWNAQERAEAARRERLGTGRASS